MDISSKYRTKLPPKEHEEAVRMLLEGINGGGKTTTQDPPQEPPSSKRALSNSYDYDATSINSLSPSTVSSEIHHHHHPHHQKATDSIISDSNSSSGIDHDAMFKEPIPSRTIAVQCDLKSSSSMRRLNGSATGSEQVVDGSMQASSISSTRYGFYNFTPETLEQRRRLQRSISSRDLTPHQNQIEAPTSMSELSVSDNELDMANRHNLSSRPHHNGGHSKPSHKRFTTSSSSYSSSSHSYAPSSAKSPPIADSVASVVNGSRQKWSTLARDDRISRDGSSMADDSSTARAKINSLPRRPMTALSYVSTTRLRDHPNAESRLNGDSSSHDERPMRSSSRAMSQQTLSTRPRTPAAAAAELDSSSEESGSELLASSVLHKSRLDPAAAAAATSQQDRFRRRQSSRDDSMQDRMRSEMSPVKPPRPTLVSSKHEEQVLDYKTLERNPSVRPSVVLQDRSNERSGYKYTARQAPDMAASAYRPPRHNQVQGNEFGNKFATIDRSARDDIIKDSYDADEYSSRLRNHQRAPMMRPPPPVDSGDLPSLKDEYQEPMRQADYRHNSMSLSRRLRSTAQLQQQQDYSGEDRFVSARAPEVGSGYYTASRIKPHKLSRNDRAHSQTHLPKSSSYLLPPSSEQIVHRRPVNKQMDEVSHTTSMRHIDRSVTDSSRYDPTNAYATPVNNHMMDSIENDQYEPDHMSSLHRNLVSEDPREIAFNKNERTGSGYVRSDLYQNQESDGDSESPLTRTWANPSVRSVIHSTTNDDSPLITSANRKSSRSYSMRDVNNGGTDFNSNSTAADRYHQRYEALRKNDISSYNSSSESSSLEQAQRFANRQQLDYNSQHRLNEIGLPEVNLLATTSRRQPEASASYLGVSGSYRDGGGGGLYTSSRGPQITGRAMSQQSLTRPTMPLTSSRRRAGGSNHSGSDVGGSSMSLVSRLHGRYENAHTRTPVVMYIPKAMPRSSSHGGDGGISLIGKSSTLRKSSRTRQKSGSSQDRSKRSLSRNGSDSESSSMLRTLVRPRSSRLQSNYSSKRTARMHNGNALHDDEDEDIDGIGQLASEMDSYKFRRRYSVPKDAKINWFAKLKQRVSSGNK